MWNWTKHIIWFSKEICIKFNNVEFVVASVEWSPSPSSRAAIVLIAIFSPVFENNISNFFWERFFFSFCLRNKKWNFFPVEKKRISTTETTWRTVFVLVESFIVVENRTENKSFYWGFDHRDVFTATIMRIVNKSHCVMSKWKTINMSIHLERSVWKLN